MYAKKFSQNNFEAQNRINGYEFLLILRKLVIIDMDKSKKEDLLSINGVVNPVSIWKL